ncbi:Atxe2 family lasso peptide isopeptidase [Stakelama sp. CBK3Z-3]|uniref:Atxe2 family lasso peptide isopeptidase n=1 Tax=Stakelama flava TaxID=2860338 RepID=A0ABS6XPS3_9SPHN|nr:Atxe2 family lasso peptide isopeptidase [Stakelama flava]MBW4332229.1 Atxe2 family lasso peptide isopeptidase [Stakelama flava]
MVRHCRNLLLAALLLLIASPAAAQDCRVRLLPPRGVADAPKRPVTASDLIELRDFGIAIDVPGGEPPFSLSPGGSRLAMLLRRADIERNSYCIGLLVIDLATGDRQLLDVGGEPTLIVADMHGLADQGTGAFDAMQPLWSPDGQWIAYQRRIAGVTQLWRVRSDGGASEQVTRGIRDVRRFVWAGDSQRLVYAIREAPEADPDSGGGYLYDDSFWPLSASVPQPPATLGFEFRTVEADNGTDRAATSEENRLLLPSGDPRLPPGAMLHAESETGALAWTGRPEGQYLGPKPLHARIGSVQFDCSDAACSDRVIGLWAGDGGGFLFLRDWGTQRRGEIEFFRWQPGKAPVSLYRTTNPLNGCLRQGSSFLCGLESAAQPRRLVRITPETGQSQVIFDPNPEFGALQFGAVTRLTAQAEDGAPAFADLVLPPEHQAGERHPLVIVQYNTRGFLRGGTGDEYPVHLLAARGYAVLSFQRPTPPAYGSAAASHTDYQRTNLLDWADRRRVFSALEALVDTAIVTGAIDESRIAITGLSDGIATIQWALLHSDRYRTAILSTCCEDPSTVAFAAGPAFAVEARAWGYPSPGAVDAPFWREYSLARNADRVAAPILIQAADREYRLALETVAMLRHAEKPVELYVFPDEYHIKWQPRHRYVIYQRVLDWLDFWLRDREDPDPAKQAQYARWRAMRAGPASAEARNP